MASWTFFVSIWMWIDGDFPSASSEQICTSSHTHPQTRISGCHKLELLSIQGREWAIDLSGGSRLASGGGTAASWVDAACLGLIDDLIAFAIWDLRYLGT